MNKLLSRLKHLAVRKVFSKRLKAFFSIGFPIIAICLFGKSFFPIASKLLNNIIAGASLITFFGDIDLLFKAIKKKIRTAEKIAISFSYSTNIVSGNNIAKIKRMISDLSRMSEFENITFVILKDNYCRTSKESASYLKNNNNISSILWLKIDRKKKSPVNHLIIKDGAFQYKGIDNNIRFHTLQFDLTDFLNINEYPGDINEITLDPYCLNKPIHHHLRNIVLYYTAVNCFRQNNSEISLKLLKCSQATENQASQRFSENSDLSKNKILKTGYFSHNIGIMILSIYQRIIEEYAKKNNLEKGLSICKHAAVLLGETTIGYQLTSLMAETNCLHGLIAEAELNTQEMERIAGGKTPDIIVNDLFFYLVRNSKESIENKCKKIRKKYSQKEIELAVCLLNRFLAVQTIRHISLDQAIVILTDFTIDQVR